MLVGAVTVAGCAAVVGVGEGRGLALDLGVEVGCPAWTAALPPGRLGLEAGPLGVERVSGGAASGPGRRLAAGLVVPTALLAATVWVFAWLLAARRLALFFAGVSALGFPALDPAAPAVGLAGIEGGSFRARATVIPPRSNRTAKPDASTRRRRGRREPPELGR